MSNKLPLSEAELRQALAAAGIEIRPHHDGPAYGWFCASPLMPDDGPYASPAAALEHGLQTMLRRALVSPDSIMPVFEVGAQWRIKDTVFADSPDPADHVVQGQIVTLVMKVADREWQVEGEGLPDGYGYYSEDELEPIEAAIGRS
jgi:hypothetical protein